MSENQNGKPSFLGRDDVMRASARRYREVNLPGGKVARIQSLKASEMRRIRNSMLDRQGETQPERMKRFEDIVVCACLVNGDGELQFTDDDAMNGVLDDVDGMLLSRLYSECAKHTGFAVDIDWQSLEAAAKN